MNFQRVVDLTTATTQMALSTNAQELTGDWEGYNRYGTAGLLAYPSGGPAPTQELGAAEYSEPALEGFITYSARVPTRRVLVVFPTKLDPSSTLIASDGDSHP